MGDLINCHAEPLVRFVPVLLDRLISLMVRPPTLAGQQVNIAQACFETVGTLVGRISVSISHCLVLCAYLAYRYMTMPVICAAVHIIFAFANRDYWRTRMISMDVTAPF